MIRGVTILCLLALGSAAQPPRVVGTPPADAGRGLVRVSESEIRHYGGKGATQYLRSLDNGETWNLVDLPASYPPVTCFAKESPAIARNPNTGEFLRAEPLYRKRAGEGMYRSEGGLDGEWIRIEDADGKPVLPGGILRTPIWVNGGKRVLIPGHGGGCYTWYSDDDGATWARSNVLQAPAHEIGGVHAGRRWNHGMVEATIVELRDKRLWMLARTAQDQHYESFSEDFGTTWSPAQPSRFWGTITMPTFHRLRDGRLLFLWSNTTPLPEVDRGRPIRGEDVFTNRDSIHAAISEDDGASWIGFRELILDEYRNREDYGVTPGSNDRGKHQSEILQLDDNRVLFSCGQHPLHRRLMIMDLRWLYEHERESDLGRDGARDWSTHQYIDKIVGHCGYNRRPGAQVRDGALRVLRVDDPSLTNPNQGATWNFPSAQRGSLAITLRLDGPGMQIALADRWFNPTDATVAEFANYVLKIARDGILTPGTQHELLLRWDAESATVSVDGQDSGLRLPRRHACPNGISYVHFYNPATQTDSDGFSIVKTRFRASRHLRLFVLTGQSNSLGTTNGGEAEPGPGADSADAEVAFWWHNVASAETSLGHSGGAFTYLRSQQGGHYRGSATHWGPEIGFARAAYRRGLRNFGIIKASRGGGGNSHWSKGAGGHMYAHIVKTVRTATEALSAQGDSFEIAGLIYVQGESDSAAESAIADTRLAELVTNLREDLPEAENMRVVIGGIAAARPRLDTVRAKQAALAARDPLISYVDSTDLRPELYDRLHFSKRAKLILGERLANAFAAESD